MKIKEHPDEWLYKLNEDYSYYNQDPYKPDNDDDFLNQDGDYQVNHLIAHWYDLITDMQKKEDWEEARDKLEDAYMDAFLEKDEDKAIYLKKDYRKEDEGMIYKMDEYPYRNGKSFGPLGFTKDAPFYSFHYHTSNEIDANVEGMSDTPIEAAAYFLIQSMKNGIDVNFEDVRGKYNG